MSDRIRPILIVSLVGLLIAVSAIAGGTAPPPYTQPNQTTVNALGGFGRTQSWKDTVASTAQDALASANIDSTIRTEMTSADVTSQQRWFYITPVCGAGTDCAFSTNVAFCVRVGPASNLLPAMTCPARNVEGVPGGGYATAIGQTIGPILLRPITSGCTDYDTCHIPVWVMSSSESIIYHISTAW